MQPRKPTEQERKELIKFLTAEHEDIHDWVSYEPTEAQAMAEEALIAVFDNLANKDKYSYSGKVMVVIYGTGDPAYSDILGWQKSAEGGNKMELHLFRRDDD